MDPRPAALQARQQDAGAESERRGHQLDRDLPAEPALAMEAATPSVAPDRVDRLDRIWEGRPGLIGWLTTVDHKRIGLMFFFTTLVFFALGGVEALLIRTQ